MIDSKYTVKEIICLINPNYNFLKKNYKLYINFINLVSVNFTKPSVIEVMNLKSHYAKCTNKIIKKAHNSTP